MRKTAILLTIAVLLAGCSSSSGNAPLSDGTREITLNCPSGLHECYQLARDACGPEGYRRVRDLEDIGFSSTDRDPSRTEQLPTRSDRGSDGQTRLTVECRAPR